MVYTPLCSFRFSVFLSLSCRDSSTVVFFLSVNNQRSLKLSNVSRYNARSPLCYWGTIFCLRCFFILFPDKQPCGFYGLPVLLFFLPMFNCCWKTFLWIFSLLSVCLSAGPLTDSTTLIFLLIPCWACCLFIFVYRPYPGNLKPKLQKFFLLSCFPAIIAPDVPFPHFGCDCSASV